MQNTKLTFRCDEDWDAMPPVAGGRHCQNCQHTVVDFTSSTRQQIMAYHAAHPGTCGHYWSEQLEPELIPLRELLTLKHAALIAGLTLGSIQVSAQAPEPAPTEQAPYAKVPGALSDSTIGSDKPDGIYGTCNRPVEATPAKRYVPRKRWYVSGRFPFLHHRRPRPIGRVVGMASF